MQDDLFDYKPPPAKYPNAPGWTEPTTSKAAAEAIRPHMTYQQRVIVEWLDERPAGAIREEIAAGCLLKESSCCGRLVELAEAGLVVKLDATRPTSSGRQAHVYVHKNHAPKEAPKCPCV